MTDLWLTVIALTIQLVSAYLAYQYLSHRSDEIRGFRAFFTFQVDQKAMLVAIVSFILSVALTVSGFLFRDVRFIVALTNAETLIWLALIGYIDLKEKIIPNVLILVGLAFWVCIVLVNIFIGKSTVKEVMSFSLPGVAIALVLFVIALIVKTALGMGDVKMFLVIGLMHGLMNTYAILLLSMVIMAVVSIILLIFKKADRKTSIPMAPFVAIGFLISILAGL